MRVVARRFLPSCKVSAITGFVEDGFRFKTFTTNYKLHTQKGAVFMRQRLFLFLEFQIQPVDDTDDGGKDDAADDLSEIDHVLTFLVLVQEGCRHGQVRCALVVREGLLDALLEFVFRLARGGQFLYFL